MACPCRVRAACWGSGIARGERPCHRHRRGDASAMEDVTYAAGLLTASVGVRCLPRARRWALSRKWLQYGERVASVCVGVCVRFLG